MAARRESSWGERALLGGFVATVMGVAALLLAVFYAWGRWERERAGTAGRAEAIVFTGWGGIEERAIFGDLVRRFRDRHREIAVEYRPIPRNYVEKLKTMMAGGVPPDVFYVPDGNFPGLVARGQLLNLQPYIARSRVIRTREFWDSALRRYRFDGRRFGSGALYALPKDIGPFAMFYNRELFRRASIPLPPAGKPWTWSEAVAVWQRLTRSSPGGGPVQQWGTFGFPLEAAVWSNGGDFLSRDARRFTMPEDARAVEAAQWLADLQLRYRVAPQERQRVSIPVDVMFLTGRLATYFGGRWMVPQFRKASFDWDVAPVPVSPRTRRPAGWSGSVGLAISPHCRHREAAWALVEFLAGPEGQAVQSRSGFQIPNQRRLAHMAIFLQPEQRPRSAAVFIEAARTQRPGPFTQTPDDKWWTLLNQYLPRVWRGEEDAATLLRRVQPEIQRALEAGWRDIGASAGRGEGE
jgi:arabinooligosaccharide transport system substrate-binding protein